MKSTEGGGVEGDENAVSEDTGNEEEDGEDHVVSKGGEDHSERENESWQLRPKSMSVSRIEEELKRSYLHHCSQRNNVTTAHALDHR